jgi:ketosteroid isomerase-like protein
MAGNNVELVRRAFAEWSQGDFRSSEGIYDPHVVLVVRAEFPDAGAYYGMEGVRKYTRYLFAAFNDFSISGEEFVEAGDSVVVRVHQRGTGAGSGVPAEIEYYMVWTFRGGTLVRMESIRDRADALAAAGLTDRGVRDQAAPVRAQVRR